MLHKTCCLVVLLFWALGGPYSLAQTTSESTAAYYADPDQLKLNILDPVLSDEQMVNADGTTFSAQAQCNAENEYLRVYALPQPDGDLDVSIIHDHDLDGAFSSAQTISDVAGVCHNGYATNCSSDFSDCDFFEWDVNASFNVSGTPSSLESSDGVYGCYCINNSCGAGLYFVNQERIHDDIGTGISLAFQAVNPSFGITNIQTNSGITSFYGHDPDTCDTGNTTQHVYYDNPSAIPSAAFSAAGASTLYTDVVNAQSSGHTATTQSCFEQHGYDVQEATISDVFDVSNLTGTTSTGSCGGSCLSINMGIDTNNNYSNSGCRQYTHAVQIELDDPDNLNWIRLNRARFDDRVMVVLDDGSTSTAVYSSHGTWNVNSIPSSCDNRTSRDENLSVSFENLFHSAGTYTLYTYVLVGDQGEVFTEFTANVDRPCSEDPTVNNTCGAIPSDCYLDYEEIDGVVTVSNTIGTGLTPLPSTQTFTGGSCSTTQTRAYWRIDRDYKCPASGSPYDFTAGLDRANVVNNSVTQTGYNDRRDVDGTLQNSAEDLTLPTLPSVSDCQQSCKTRKTVDELGIATMGLSVGSRPDDTRYEYSFKACVDSTCPLEAGETIETPCGCLDRFSEAASAIQAFRLAGKDFVCTTETP